MTIAIDAPPDVVFEAASDPTRWPALLPHYIRVDVLGHRDIPGHAGGGRGVVARYVALRPLLSGSRLGFPVAWTSLFWADPVARKLHFRHLAGATTGMVVTWHIEERGAGSVVRLEHVFESPRLPGPLGRTWYPRLIDRFFVRPIAGRTLATFRRLCEAMSERPPRVPGSGASAEGQDARAR